VLDANQSHWQRASLLTSSGQRNPEEVLQFWLEDSKMRERLLMPDLTLIGGAQVNHKTKTAFWVVILSNDILPAWLHRP
jgi:uncharacterized protein YkwD